MTKAVTSALAAQRISNDTPVSAGTLADLRTLTRRLAGYREPSHRRSIIEILITLVPFILLWLLMWWSLRIGYGIYLLLAVPAAGFLVRLFMIQHDCGHGSFFRHRLVNDWIGRVIGVFTLTPYDNWRRAHGIHHATNIWRVPAGAGWAIASTAIPLFCSASARPIYSSCASACRSG